MKIGYIGLGDIGTPIAERILKQGLDLTLWNRTRGKMTPFVTAGASAAASPSDLARRSEIVALCVDSAEAIEQILSGSEGLVCALDKPRLVVDHSTIHPRQAIGFASRLAHHGIAMIDAPVSGGAAGARYYEAHVSSCSGTG